MDKQELNRIDRELIRIAQEGTTEEFVQAMLDHPIDGPLLRAFALEEDAPEYVETMRRIREKFFQESESLSVARSVPVP